MNQDDLSLLTLDDYPSVPGKTDGITEIDGSETYLGMLDPPEIVNFTLRAADRQRPYLQLKQDWTLASGLDEGAQVTLDGLWFGVGTGMQIVLKGHFRRVTIRHTTLDPGEEDESSNVIPPVHLVIQGQVERLEIESSITGPIYTDMYTDASGNPKQGAVDELVIHDSILQSTLWEHVLRPILPSVGNLLRPILLSVGDRQDL